MAKKAICEGEVVVKDGTHSAIEFYTAEFVLDDSVETLAQARSMIQAGLITERLRREVSNFKRVRTCDVIEFTKTNESPEHGELDKLLLKATELGCMPENIESYKKPEAKAKALQKAVDRALERNGKAKDNVTDLGYVD